MLSVELVQNYFCFLPTVILYSHNTIYILDTGNDGTASQNFYSMIWRKNSAIEHKIGKHITTPLFCLCKVSLLLTS